MVLATTTAAASRRAGSRLSGRAMLSNVFGFGFEGPEATGKKSVSPAGQRFYRPELDALRLCAFLMVWLSHSLPPAAEATARGLSRTTIFWLEAIKDAGNFGVCVFFFLSAYLITELLRRERQTTGSVHLRAFYLRRILRIWPLYLGVLGAYALLGLRFHGFQIEPGRLLASVLLAGNWYIALHPGILTPMRALWSLSVEEQFYAAWPLLARFLPATAMGAVCAGWIVVAHASLFWLATASSVPAMLHLTAWVNSLVQFQFFALGALAALLGAGRVPRLGAGWRWLLGAAAAAAMLVAAAGCLIKRPLASHTAASLMVGYLLVGLGCASLFLSVLGLRQGTAPTWMVRLGQVSFGLYVFHETGFFFADVLQRRLMRTSVLAHTVGVHGTLAAAIEQHWAFSLLANKLLALGFTVVLALASYHFWERPFLRLKRRFTFIETRLA